MGFTIISVAPDVLTRLLALRSSENEGLDEVFRRYLPGDALARAEPTQQNTAATSGADVVGLPYQIMGEAHTASDATEAMVNILRGLAQYDDDFFPKLAAGVRGRTRNHVARSRLDVYPDRPDLARYVKQVGPGWFIGCNIANREKEKILRAACKIMGLVFGLDLEINLGSRGTANAAYQTAVRARQQSEAESSASRSRGVAA
jgi:hypothetical protein